MPPKKKRKTKAPPPTPIIISDIVVKVQPTDLPKGSKAFGAPGHGKGKFDGLGGAMKNKVHSLIKGSKAEASDKIPGTESG